MANYSIFTLARNALNRHRDWPQAWRSPKPRPSYDAVIVGGGGHGLATAYYLADRHGMHNSAEYELHQMLNEDELLCVPLLVFANGL